MLEYDSRTEGMFLVGLEEGDSLADVLEVGFFMEDTSRVDTFSIWASVTLKTKVF